MTKLTFSAAKTKLVTFHHCRSDPIGAFDYAMQNENKITEWAIFCYNMIKYTGKENG